jgi:hypothetical protein
MYRIIGVVNGHYIVITHNGLKRGKISHTDMKNINNETKIENL